MRRPITEGEALQDIVNNANKFKQYYGFDAIEDAIKNGAFQSHAEFGSVKEIIFHRDFDDTHVTVPQWFTDIFIEHNIN